MDALLDGRPLDAEGFAAMAAACWLCEWCDPPGELELFLAALGRIQGVQLPEPRNELEAALRRLGYESENVILVARRSISGMLRAALLGQDDGPTTMGKAIEDVLAQPLSDLEDAVSLGGAISRWLFKRWGVEVLGPALWILLRNVMEDPELLRHFLRWSGLLDLLGVGLSEAEIVSALRRVLTRRPRRTPRNPEGIIAGGRVAVAMMPAHFTFGWLRTAVRREAKRQQESWTRGVGGKRDFDEADLREQLFATEAHVEEPLDAAQAVGDEVLRHLGEAGELARLAHELAFDGLSLEAVAAVLEQARGQESQLLRALSQLRKKRLTRRELQVAIAKGLAGERETDRDLAARLGMNPSTFGVTWSNVRRKLRAA